MAAAAAAPSAEQAWYDELFKQQLQSVARTREDNKRPADEEYELYFYTRSLGLDFAVGKVSGCCVVCAVAEEHRSRVEPGDVVLCVNGAQLATSSAKPLMGFFAALNIIRCASLPATLQFLSRFRKPRSQHARPVASPSAIALDAAHELHGEARTLTSRISPALRKRFRDRAARGFRTAEDFVAVVEDDGDFEEMLSAVPLPNNWHAVAASNETRGRMFFAPDLAPIVNGQRVEGHMLMERLHRLLSTRVRSRQEARHIVLPIAYILRPGEGGVNEADARALLRELFEAAGNGVRIAGDAHMKGAARRRAEGTFEIVVDDGVLVRSTHWFGVHLGGGGTGQASAGGAHTTPGLTLKVTVKEMMVSSRPALPTRIASIVIDEPEEDSGSSDEEDAQSGTKGKPAKAPKAQKQKHKSKPRDNELAELFDEGDGDDDDITGPPVEYLIELGRGETLLFVEGANGEAITPLNERPFVRKPGAKLGPAEQSGRLDCGDLLVQVGVDDDAEDVRGLPFELTMAVLRNAPDGGRLLTFCKPRPTIVAMPNTPERSALRHQHTSKEPKVRARRNFEFEVTLLRHEQSGFGFNLFPIDGFAMIEKFRPNADGTAGAAEASGVVQVADVLVGIGAASLKGLEFDAVIGALLQCEKGLRHPLRFVRFPVQETDRLMAKAGFAPPQAKVEEARKAKVEAASKAKAPQDTAAKPASGGFSLGLGSMRLGGSGRAKGPPKDGAPSQEQLLAQFRAQAELLDAVHMRAAMVECQSLLEAASTPAASEGDAPRHRAIAAAPSDPPAQRFDRDLAGPESEGDGSADHGSRDVARDSPSASLSLSDSDGSVSYGDDDDDGEDSYDSPPPEL